ncbi:MAG: [FeFe] hydrogenase, group A [Proteobacteria bacterium]|nr:[FeFe] hydrogenase, group A [Pseudomonadota bacterium]
MNVANITINNKKITVESGTTILEAAQKLHIKIPTLCHLDLHDIKMVNQSASCRICSVEVEGRRNLAPACATPVADGMTVKTNSMRAIQARRTVLELILSDHPFTCLSCAKSTDCELQTLAFEFGIDIRPFQGQTSRYPLDISNNAIRRDLDKCIMCRRCETICNEVQTVGVLTGYQRGFDAVVAPADMQPLSESTCVFCGQCVSVCPTGALTEQSSRRDIWNALFDPDKYVIAQTAPAIRAAIGEEFGMKPGRSVTGKLVAALRNLGFDDVFDTDFAADLTIMEEANEIIERITKKENLPILTSCCPGWISFLEYQFPDLAHIPSSCKSPQQMMGAVVKSYYAQKLGKKPEDIVMVSIMPCLAKKYEAARPEFTTDGVPDVDHVVSTRGLAKMIKEAGIDLATLEDEDFDHPLGESTGAGVIFGASGGVMEAALRTAYETATGKQLAKVDFKETRGLEQIKTATVDMDGTQLRLAITSGLGSARTILEQIRNNEAQYDIIEIMACPGGCINGGGQPSIHGDFSVIEKRRQALYSEDEGKALRKSHLNPSIQKLYKDFLGKPGSKKAHDLLHTHYFPNKDYNEK